MTMARDEAGMLKRWVDYYGNQLGFDNLIVLDDNSADGSTRDLPCTVYRLPPPPWKAPWSRTRREFFNGFTRSLLTCYDAVIVTDVDEFLVPDPIRYDGLLDYIGAASDWDVVAPVALNVLHNPRYEPDLDANKPVMAQRRFVKFAPSLCKPLITRSPSEWLAGLHGIRAPFEVDRELFMLHLKFSDLATMRAVSQQRQDLFDKEGRGSPGSSWPLGPDELTSRLLSWVNSSGPVVKDFDPGELDLRYLVHRTSDGSYRTQGSQLRAMKQNPLRQLPDRFRSLL